MALSIARSTIVTPLIAVVGLSLAGVGVAGYLTWVHFDERLLVCATGGCETVQQSAYSEIGGLPVAGLGLLMYLAVAALALARLTGRTRAPQDLMSVASWTLLLAGTLYAGYLTYVEIWVIEAICQWCVVSAALTVLAFIAESIVLARVLRDD